MRSAQPVNNRIMNLTQSVADLLQNSNFPTCESFSSNRTSSPTFSSTKSIDSGIFNCRDHFNEFDNPTFFNDEHINRKHGKHRKHSKSISGSFNEPFSSADCEHHKHSFKPIDTGFDESFNQSSSDFSRPIESVSPGFSGTINPIPCNPVEPVSPAFNEVCNPVAGEHSKSFTNLGTFINLGTFFNNCPESDILRHRVPCPGLQNSVDLNQPCVSPESVIPGTCCHPDLLRDFNNPVSFKDRCRHPRVFNNLFGKLDFLNRRCCHPEFIDCFCLPEKFKCCPIKANLIIAFELAKGSVRALPLRLFRKKEILEVLERAEKLIGEAPCLSIELINSVLTLLQLASLKVRQFTTRCCIPSNVFITSSPGCSSQSFFSTRCCSFR